MKYKVSGHILGRLLCETIVSQLERHNYLPQIEEAKKALEYSQNCLFEHAREACPTSLTMLHYCLCSMIERKWLEAFNHEKRCSSLWRNIYDKFKHSDELSYLLCDKKIIDMIISEYGEENFEKSIDGKTIQYMPSKNTFASLVA